MQCLSSPWDLGLEDGEIYNALTFAKEIRNRYTILQLADQMGVLEGYVKKIVAENKG